jgi:NDMA-dependent alcohol dehydrogenase
MEDLLMKTNAAVVLEVGVPIEMIELDLDEPRDGEVLVRYLYAGLCHSDIHIAHGDLDARLPMVLGHEGAGIIEKVGSGVSRVRPGDHVVCSYIPSCGVCRYCASGRQSICDMGATLMQGSLPGGHFPFTGPHGQYGAMCLVGSFSQYGVLHQTSVIKISDDLPLDKAVLVGCGVPTGWGAAVNTADVTAGDTVAVFGVGGIGIHAVQGARYAGAKYVVAVDPLSNKREKAAQLGATHTFATAEEAIAAIAQLTGGHMADSVILAPGLMTAEIVASGVNAVGKGGVVVMVALGKRNAETVVLAGSSLTSYRKTVKGSLFGDCNPTADIPKILGLYLSGHIELDGLITRSYPLERVQQGYDDLLAGEILRGVVAITH